MSGEYENGFAQGRWEYFDKKGRLRSSGIAKGVEAWYGPNTAKKEADLSKFGKMEST